MSSPIATLPPPGQYVPPDADWHAGRDVPDYAFSDLWQNREKGLGFGDLLDIVNPLQHIPLVSSVYRMITGDEIGVGARLAGGALFGGPIGALAASAVALFEGASGKTVEQHIAALFEEAPTTLIAGDSPPVAGQAATAGAQPVPAAPSERIALAPPPAAEKPVPATTAPDPAKASSQPATDAAAERQRIARAVEQAQRAQAGLLLASMEANRAASRQTEPERDSATDTAAAGATQPFRDHPYMLPPGAPPQAISRAMEQALMRYQSMLQQRSGGETPAAPRAVPSPVR